jgi:class 3 adenylate cyclase/tetratricopeptide (TPR) repeat protein
MTPTRRLAAIMFTDIVGYTALMQENEAQALVIRQRHREVFERFHKQHKGQIVQYYGDGTLSVFDSAVDAVTCAQAIQLALQEEPRVPLRIGLHTGDVLLSDTEVIGDGVNIASRVESLAIPGSILLSESLYAYIKNQPEFTVRSLGTFGFKNVAKPLEVFALNVPGIAVPDPRKMTGKFEWRNGGSLLQRFQRLPVWSQYLLGFLLFLILAPVIYFPLMQGRLDASPAGEYRDADGNVIRREVIPASEVKSLYVSHFDNASGDSSLNWLMAGLPFVLEMEWDQDPYMFNQYDPGRTHKLSLKEKLDFAGQMQHERLLTGSYAYAPQTGYEVQIQIYQVQTGTQEKSIVYRGRELFGLIDSMSRDIKLQLGVPAAYAAQAADLPAAQYLTSSMPAFQAFANGILGSHASGGYFSIGELERALQLDSTFAWCAFTLGETYRAYQRSPKKIQSASALAMRHRKRLPDVFESNVRLFYYSQHGEADKALDLARLLARMNPQNLNYWLSYLQQALEQEAYEETLEALKEFKQLRYDARIYTGIAAHCHFQLKQYKQAIELLENYVEAYPEDRINQLALGQMYLAVKKPEKARQIFEQGALLAPEQTAFAQFIKHMDFAAAGGKVRFQPEQIAGEYWMTNASSIRAVVTWREGQLYLRTGNQYRMALYPVDSVNYCTAFGLDISLLPDSSGGVRGFRIYQNGQYRGGALKAGETVQAAFTQFAGPDPQAAAPLLEQAIAAHPSMAILRRMRDHLAFRQTPAYASAQARYPAVAGRYRLLNQIFSFSVSEGALWYQQVESAGYDSIRLYEYAPGQFFSLENLTQIIEVKQERGKPGTVAIVASSGERFVFERIR